MTFRLPWFSSKNLSFPECGLGFGFRVSQNEAYVFETLNNKDSNILGLMLGFRHLGKLQNKRNLIVTPIYNNELLVRGLTQINLGK